MSVDFPNEAARCQRFLSGRAQSNFDAQGKPGPVARCNRRHFRCQTVRHSSSARAEANEWPSVASGSIWCEAAPAYLKVIVTRPDG